MQLACSLEPEFLRLFVQPIEVCWALALFDLPVSFVAGWNGPRAGLFKAFFPLEEVVEGFVLHKLDGITAREVCLAASCSSTQAGGTVYVLTRGHRASAQSLMGFIQWASLLPIKAPADGFRSDFLGCKVTNSISYRDDEPLGQVEREGRWGWCFLDRLSQSWGNTGCSRAKKFEWDLSLTVAFYYKERRQIL